jgi:hypothetical protein
MRPKLLSAKNIILLLTAVTIFSALAVWLKNGMPLPGKGVPSTAGKIAFVSTRNGKPDIWMMDGTDGGNAVALTNDEAEDRSPTWSLNGSEIAFVSGGRKGVTPQIFRMDAMSGAKVIQVSNTSSSKDAPQYSVDNFLYYLDTGKVVAYNIIGNDSTAILPSADLKLLLNSYFERGGIEKMAISPDGTRYLVVLKLEEGKALVQYLPEAKEMALLGVATNIFVSYKPDGGFQVVFAGGAPSQPLPMLTEEMAKSESFAPLPLEQFRPPTEMSIVVVYDAGGTVMGEAEALPYSPTSAAFSPDGSQVALAYEEGGEMQGLVLAPVGLISNGKPIFDKPAQSPAWSPDGKTIAFVHANDIYTISPDGGEAKNLTKGQGASSQPIWSPTLPATK